jgi:hypothetical protein
VEAFASGRPHRAALKAALDKKDRVGDALNCLRITRQRAVAARAAGAAAHALAPAEEAELENTLAELLTVLEALDDEIAPLVEADGEGFSRRWGHLTRAGVNDRSQLMRQVEKYEAETILETNQPTNRPTDQPTNRPTDQPTNQPTNRPTTHQLPTATQNKIPGTPTSTRAASRTSGATRPTCTCARPRSRWRTTASAPMRACSARVARAAARGARSSAAARPELRRRPLLRGVICRHAGVAFRHAGVAFNEFFFFFVVWSLLEVRWGVVRSLVVGMR